jgi:hypothetical protein
MIKIENMLLSNIEKIHTTAMGFDRIQRNLQLQTEDVVGWCIKHITNTKSSIRRKGKNWYVSIDNIEITIHAHSFTIITAHTIGNLEAREKWKR